MGNRELTRDEIIKWLETHKNWFRHFKHGNLPCSLVMAVNQAAQCAGLDKAEYHRARQSLLQR